MNEANVASGDSMETATEIPMLDGTRTPGDVNGDGKVNGVDLIRLKQYFAGYEVTIDESNSDVTGDGKVSGPDLIRLSQYFAGFDVTLK